MKNNTTLVHYLKNESKAILTSGVENAFLSVDRKDFVPTENKGEAYADYPLPIGIGQTISQPTTIAFMLELLDVKKRFSILDIGSGSGYTTALLAMLTGEQGFVLGVDIYPELIDFASKNLSHYFLPQAKIILGKPSQHAFEGAPFDRILVSAQANEIPDKYVHLLKVNGIMVIPIQNDIVKILKISLDKLSTIRYSGFRFVPLITS